MMVQTGFSMIIIDAIINGIKFIHVGVHHDYVHENVRNMCTIQKYQSIIFHYINI